MALTDQQLNDIRDEVYLGPIHNNIPVERNDPFWTWFQENAEVFFVNPAYNIHETDENMHSGNCFGNSQSNSVRSHKDYAEGFVTAGYELIFHGFNINENNQVEDITVQNNLANFTDNYNNLPDEYYGIIIPQEYLNENLPEDIGDNFFNKDALIFEYYNSL